MEHKSITELQTMLRNGTLSAKTLCQYFADRITRLDSGPGCNAVARLSPVWEIDAMQLDCFGDTNLPLFGIPFLVMDSIDVKDMPTSCGSAYLRNNYPQKDAPIVRLLKEAGAVCLGKASMTELCGCLSSKLPQGFSSVSGQARSVRDEPVPGGFGAASAVADGLIPFAIATDCVLMPLSGTAGAGVLGYRAMPEHLSTEGTLLGNKGAMTVFCRQYEDLLCVLQILQPMSVPAVTNKMPLLASSESIVYLPPQLQAAMGNGKISLAGKGSPQELFYHTAADAMDAYFEKNVTAAGSAVGLRMAYENGQKAYCSFGLDRLDEAVRMQSNSGQSAQTAELPMLQRRTYQQLCYQLRDVDAVLLTDDDIAVDLARLPCLCFTVQNQEGQRIPVLLTARNEERLLFAAEGLIRLLRENHVPVNQFNDQDDCKTKIMEGEKEP